MAQTFAADIRNFAELTMDQATRVMRQSVQEVMQDAQTPVAQGGSMPVDLGDLRGSLVSHLNGHKIAEGDESFILTIAQMEPGDVGRFAWTAGYAIARHYKPEDFGQGGGMWRDKAAANWQRIVERNAKAVR